MASDKIEGLGADLSERVTPPRNISSRQVKLFFSVIKRYRPSFAAQRP